MIVIEQAPSPTEELSVAHDVSVEQQQQEEEEQEVVDAEWDGNGEEEEIEQTIQAANAEITAALETPLDLLAVDWEKYPPPKGLRYTGDIESDEVLRIVQESIDRIKTRIREEEERKLEAEIAGRALEEQAGQEDDRAKQPESIADPARGDTAGIDNPEQPPGSEQDAAAGSVGGAAGFLTELPKRPRKRTLTSLFRKLNGSPEHGESSAAGAARHRLLTSSSRAELVTLSARKRFVIDLIRKAAGEYTSPTSSLQEPEVECVSCLDDFAPSATVRAPSCGHHYCTPCFGRLVAAACESEQRWPPRCCLGAIPRATVLAHAADDGQRDRYRARAREWDLPAGERVYCGRPDCSLFIRPEYVIAAQGVARCDEGHYTCIACRGPRHEDGGGGGGGSSGEGGSICPRDWELARTSELAAAEGWQRCPGCGAYVEHREACQHMTCRCGAEFCYVCGARWRGCACTMEQLGAVKARAAALRRERAEAEAREAAEALEAVRLVAAFEREEARKAELLRRERARAREERRARELEARIAREGERRRAVMLRFGALRAALDALHGAQEAAVRARQERRAAALRARVEKGLRRLLEAHAGERAARRAGTDGRIAAREAALGAEYAARLAEERRIEARYAAELRAFWDGREGGEESARRARDDLGRKMDAAFRAWRKWSRNELDACRHHAREELAIAEELMDEGERRARRAAAAEAREAARRGAAELCWVREVVAERNRLLDDGEIAELEGGEDIDAWFAESPEEEEEEGGEGEGEALAMDWGLEIRDTS